MRPTLWQVLFGLCALCHLVASRTIVERDTFDRSLDPNFQTLDSVGVVRDKRDISNVKYGVKNALIGFVFNKINSFIDQKTRWLDQLDRTNIAKNAQHGIVAPSDPVVSLTNVISGAIGQKLQAAGPLIGVAVQTLTSGSGGLSGGSGGFNIGSLLGGLSGGGGGGASANLEPSSTASNKVTAARRPLTTTTRKPTTTQDIVIFEKNKPVSLEFPDQLFGSSFTLVTNLSESIGDFMINSALRTQRLLESMRPFLRAIFGVKGIVLEATDNSKPIFSDGSNNDV